MAGVETPPTIRHVEVPDYPAAHWSNQLLACYLLSGSVGNNFATT
jgi:hypothetical protein